MKNLMLFMLGMGFFLINCKNERNNDSIDNNANPVIMTDTTAFDSDQSSPDTMDASPRVDTSNYDINSNPNLK